MNIAEFEAMCQVSACDSMILYILGEVYLPHSYLSPHLLGELRQFFRNMNGLRTYLLTGMAINTAFRLLVCIFRIQDALYGHFSSAPSGNHKYHTWDPDKHPHSFRIHCVNACSDP